MTIFNRSLLWLWAAAWTAGCSSTAMFPVPGVADARVIGDTYAGNLNDTSADALVTCPCATDQVWLHGACVPTFGLGCGSPCKPKTCTAPQVCDPLAASSSCEADDVRAACVPRQSMTFQVGALRVSPTQVGLGETVQVTVQGGRFYIGALWWDVQIGAELLKTPDQYGAACVLTGTWTPKKAGVYAVQVGYGGIKTDRVRLAGFITVSDSASPTPSAQPGYPCSTKTVCAQAAGWTCGCGAAARCACSPTP